MTPVGINDEMYPYLRMTLPRGLERIDPAEGFLERSTMLSQRLWEHERTLEPVEDGCRVTDRVRWEPRLGLPASPLRPLFGWFFRHRHKRLVRHFGRC